MSSSSLVRALRRHRKAGPGALGRGFPLRVPKAEEKGGEGVARLRYPRYQDCRREERGAVSAVPRGQPLGLRVSTCPPPPPSPCLSFPVWSRGDLARPRHAAPSRCALRHCAMSDVPRATVPAALPPCVPVLLGCPRAPPSLLCQDPLPGAVSPSPGPRGTVPGAPRPQQQDGSRMSPPWSLLEVTLMPCPPRAPHHCPTPRGDFGDVFTLTKAGMFPGARPLWGQRLSPAQGVAGPGVPPAPLPAPHRPPIVSGRPKSKFIPDDLMSGFRWQRDSSGASASLNPSRPRHT